MLRLASDEDFPGMVIQGLLRRRPELDLVRIVDVGLSTAHDQVILEWAAGQGRILLTRDKKTLLSFANARVAAGLPMTGVFVLRENTSTRDAIDELLLLATCSGQEEWANRVEFIPL